MMPQTFDQATACSGQDRSGAVSRVVQGLMRRAHVPGLSLAVVAHDRLLYAAGFGQADVGSADRMTERTAHLWFSMSKLVTGTAAMRLSDEGALDLDAPVSRYLPSSISAAGAHQPRVGQLLNHTAGLANPLPLRWVRPAGAPVDDEHFIQRILRRYGRPRRPPGGHARYSNIGYLVLAEVIATVAGMPFEDYVSSAVLGPLGMTRTGYRYLEGAPAATGHVRMPAVLTPALRLVMPAGIVGSRHGGQTRLNKFYVRGAGYGGLVGDVVDAGRFAAMHLGDGTLGDQRILRVETARRMRRVQTPGKPFDMGIAWFRRPTDEAAKPIFVEHLGAGGGFFNAMRLYPDLDLAMVMMSNSTHPIDRDTLFDALREIEWQVTTTPPGGRP
jgi:CubicO group peptidase (beta-lactamase class C family)